MLKWIKGYSIGILSIILIGFLIPQNLRMPVVGADSNSYNHEIFWYTEHYYKTTPALINAVRQSVSTQYMVAEEDNIDQPISETKETKYIVSGKRSFESAKDYVGKKIAVLNYANNLSIGGAPFYAGAQEESLYRCSTLLPCLQAMKVSFYHKHHELYSTKLMWGTDVRSEL